MLAKGTRMSEMGKALMSLEAGRNALERHAWAEALGLLKQADAAKEIDAEGLEMLADARWWMAQPADSMHDPRCASWARLRRLRHPEAARVGGAAEGGEILVSAATLQAAKTTYPSKTRSLTLKDIAEPVEVASIEWR